MNCIKLCAVVVALGSAIVCSYSQAAITVDGNLSDWGITLGSNGHFSYAAAYGYTYPGNPTQGKQGTATIGGNTVAYDLEDSNDNSNNYQVGPLYGGQNYDAEVLVASVVGSNLYIGIASGQRPDNGAQYYCPGDICLTKGSTTWGIEVGGGPGSTTTPSPPRNHGRPERQQLIRSIRADTPSRPSSYRLKRRDRFGKAAPGPTASLAPA